MMATSANSCSRRLNNGLYSLCVECFIAVLTLIDVLAITAELLIRLEILRLPQDDGSLSISSSNTLTTPSTNDNNITIDPGGPECSGCHFTTDNFGITLCAFHYISVVIAGMFFIEVVDGLVVLILVAMEILFTTFWQEVLCYHDAVEAATYIVIFRFLRIKRACNISRNRYAEKMELTTHYLRECKLKSDEENKQHEKTIRRHEIEIENLKKQILRYEIENTKHQDERVLEGRSTEFHEVPNGHIPGINDKPVDHIDKTEKKENGNESPSFKDSVKSDKQSSYIIQECESRQNRNNGDFKSVINVENYAESDRRETTPIVYDYEQGTGEFIPILDKNVILEERQDVGDNENNKQIDNSDNKKTEHAKPALKKSLSEGSRLYKLQDDNVCSPDTEVNHSHFNRSNSVEAGHVHDIVSQLENIAKDKLRSSKIKRRSSDKDKLIIKDDENDSAIGADNIGLDIDELDEVQKRNLPVMAEYEGTRTYRSAEGIPLTDL